MMVVVAYDVIDDARRNRVAKTLKNFGERIQYSVFSCELSAAQFRTVKSALNKIVDPELDRVHFFSLCRTCVDKREAIPSSLVDPKPGAILIA